MALSQEMNDATVNAVSHQPFASINDHVIVISDSDEDDSEPGGALLATEYRPIDDLIAVMQLN